MAISIVAFDFQLTDIVVMIVSLWIGYHAILALYNVSPLHPLNHFPGPRLAAASFWYEAWFDLVQGGRYTREIQRMHDTYGPVVRINPEELHFNDVAFVDEIYAGRGRRRDKQRHFLNFVAGPITRSMFATVDHDHHRIRRKAINNFFSKAQITKLEPSIKYLVDMLCNKIDRLSKTGEPLDVTTAYSCFTADVISGYCFGEPFGFVEQPDWEPNFKAPLNAFLSSLFLFRFFPLLKGLTDLAPLFAKYLSDDIANMLKESNERLPARIRKAKEDVKAGKIQDPPSIITTVLASDLPESEKTEVRLGGESFSMITAGTETTAWTLTVLTFYLLNQPDTLAKLTKELHDADALNKPWASLEQLPYLSAVLTESLRLSYGVGARLPRVARDEVLVYRGQFQGRDIEHIIPSGTPMGMSNAIHHHNEDIYPESNKFIPERWLEAQGPQRRRMEAALLTFSRGSRQCLGSNLAYCNMYLAVTALTLRIFPRMRLHRTTVRDVKYDHDLFIPLPENGSKGVRVILI